MNIYQRFLLPRIVNCACASKPTMMQRQKIVPLAEGRALGINMPLTAVLIDLVQSIESGDLPLDWSTLDQLRKTHEALV